MAGPLEKNFKIQPKRLKSMTHFQTGQFLKNEMIILSDVIAGDDLSIDIPKLRGDQHLLDLLGPLSFGRFFFVWPVIFYRVIENISLASSSNNSSTVFCPVSWIYFETFPGRVDPSQLG
jgi:hypothetical protein